MLAKGFVAGIQFEELFKDNLFFEMAEHANEMADILRNGIKDLGYSFGSDSPTNQLFPIFPDQVVEELSKDFGFNIIGPHNGACTEIRLVTSWATPEKAVRDFLNTLKK